MDQNYAASEKAKKALHLRQSVDSVLPRGDLSRSEMKSKILLEDNSYGSLRDSGKQKSRVGSIKVMNKDIDFHSGGHPRNGTYIKYDRS